MRVGTKIFVHEHGQSPRGTGCWAFSYGVTEGQAKYYGIDDAPIITRENPNACVWLPSMDEAVPWKKAKELAVEYGEKIGYKGTIYLLS